MSMFCFQCEQTAKGTGCTVSGVCGKDPATATLQDLLVHATTGVAQYAHRARKQGARDRGVDRFVVEALFTTVTNVNFDADSLESMLRRASEVKAKARRLFEDSAASSGNSTEALSGPASWDPADTRDGLLRQGGEVGVAHLKAAVGEDLACLHELVVYGLKGTAAYADHAMVLGRESEEVYAFFHEALDALATPPHTVDGLFALAMRCGEVNLKAMQLLDEANTGTYGHPAPTPVRVHPKKGKAVLVSGHDLKDLEALLKQTEGTGVQVYTHGEMLPAHGYPGLKKFAHLAGNYGGAWQDQRDEFDAFPGAILMTTNCIQRPKDGYKCRIFTSGLVAWPGVAHIADADFAPVVQAALAAPGFTEDGPDDTILVGFGHQAVLGAAEKVVELVKKGAIKRFFLVGGCDGAKSGRNYYADFARAVPEDCVILTLACGKYRFNKLQFGDIEGLPRLLDMGQCNDAYSAIQVAAALASAFQTGVNGLPLSLVLSWYEQKAVCILLTLLHLGIRNIRLGPSLPAFVTPGILAVLVEKFNITPIADAGSDIGACLSAC